MAKTNFSKVESSLIEALHKMNVNELLELSMDTSKKRKINPVSLIKFIHRELMWVYQKDKKIFDHLKVDKSKLKEIIDNPEKVNRDDLKYIITLKKELDAYKKEKLPQKTDDELIQSEIERHVNKRFNVNEKWLPLK